MSAIHIILHGLIALVPATDPGGVVNHMTALLVDARNEPPGLPSGFKECFVSHQSVLTVKVDDSAQCKQAGCTFEGQDDCVCKLDRTEISLAPDVDLQKQQLAKLPASSLPFDQQHANDFSYVANMSQPPLHQELDPRFLEPLPPPELAARMTFPFASIAACSLGTRRDEGSENVHPLGFRPLRATEQPGEVNQAMAQRLVASYEISQGPLILTLSTFGGGNQRHLTLKPIGDDYEIMLVNMRGAKSDGTIPNDVSVDEACDDGVGRDFAFFYQLVKNPPPWEKRPIPHIKYTRWKSSSDLVVDECSHKTHFPDSHPICAMATFNH
ncbi:MAG: hypothetical protein ACJ76Y_16130 [Thermoanaerobaculia bacterium]